MCKPFEKIEDLKKLTSKRSVILTSDHLTLRFL